MLLPSSSLSLLLQLRPAHGHNKPKQETSTTTTRTTNVHFDLSLNVCLEPEDVPRTADECNACWYTSEQVEEFRRQVYQDAAQIFGGAGGNKTYAVVDKATVDAVDRADLHNNKQQQRQHYRRQQPFLLICMSRRTRSKTKANRSTSKCQHSPPPPQQQQQQDHQQPPPPPTKAQIKRLRLALEQVYHECITIGKHSSSFAFADNNDDDPGLLCTKALQQGRDKLQASFQELEHYWPGLESTAQRFLSPSPSLSSSASKVQDILRKVNRRMDQYHLDDPGTAARDAAVARAYWMNLWSRYYSSTARVFCHELAVAHHHAVLHDEQDDDEDDDDDDDEDGKEQCRGKTSTTKAASQYQGSNTRRRRRYRRSSSRISLGFLSLSMWNNKQQQQQSR